MERVEYFGNDEIILVGYESRDPLLPAEQERLRRVVRKIERLPLVAETRSVLDAQWIEGDQEALRVRPYGRAAKRAPERRGELLDRMRADPFAAGLLISDGARAAALVIELATGTDRPVERLPELIAEVRAIFEAEDFARDSLHVVGLPVTVGAVIETTYWNFKTLFPVVCVVLLLAVWVLFRRLWPVFIAFGVASIAVVWTMGFAVSLDRHVSVLVSTVPAVILVISFSDVIHLISAYLLELGSGRSKADAILAAGTDVGTACLWTSATTFVGFVALAMVPTPVFRQLGIVLGAGVGVSLLIAVTLVPILFSLLPEPASEAWGGSVRKGHTRDPLGRFLNWAAGVSRRWPRQVVVAFAFVGVAALVAASQIRVETDFARRLDGEHQVRKDIAWFAERFVGASTLDVYLNDASSASPGGLLRPDVMEHLDVFQGRIAAMPEVTRVVSVADLFKEVHGALHAEEHAASSASPPAELPDSAAAFAQYLLLFEGAGGEGLDRLIDFERRRLRLVVTLNHEQVRATYESGQRVLAASRDLFGPDGGDGPKGPALAGVDVEVSGLLYLKGDWLEEIVIAQKKSVLYALFFITLMMLVALRSFRVGLWSMIPNLFPILLLGGWLGLAWGDIDSDIMGLAVIALGIGVDDTIHFLVRLKREWARTDSVESALTRTFHFTGRGIIITTLILAVGFAPFYAADYLSVRVMGNLLPMTLVLALLADLFLVPALVQLGWIRFGDEPGEGGRSGG